LVPILNDAYDYYKREDYKDDGAARAKALHAKLVPAIDTFLTARKRLGGAPRGAERGARQSGTCAHLEDRGQERALAPPLSLDHRQGGAEHVAGASDPQGDEAFSAAILTYAQAVRDFDDFNKTTGTNEHPNTSSYLVELRELRDKIEKKHATQVDFRERRHPVQLRGGHDQWLCQI
jgi:hypothetical protein